MICAKKIIEKVKDNWAFALLISLLAVYYIWRMFTFGIGIDESITYYWSIHKGLLYSVACWVAPNNHVLFSALSSIVDMVIPGAIGLRGISFLASVGTIALLYKLLKGVNNKKIALIGVLLYSMCRLPNELAVQGRGYALASFFLMVAIYASYKIIQEETFKKWCIIFALSLWGGIYTVMTSIYWVIPICICVGVLLLLQKQYSKLKKTVGWSVLAALCTFFCYSVIFFTMGASQLATDRYNLSEDIRILLQKPLECYKEGFSFVYNGISMYSPGRTGISLLDVYTSFVRFSFPYGTTVMAIVIVICLVLCACVLARVYHEESNGKLWVYFVSVLGTVIVCFIPYVQGNIPFDRTFSFTAIFFVLCISSAVAALSDFVKTKKVIVPRYVKLVMLVLLCLGNGMILTSCEYMMAYDSHVDDIHDAIDHVDWENVSSYSGFEYCVYYDKIICDKLTLEYNEECADIMFVAKDEIDTEKIQGMVAVYENDSYIVYQRL